MIVRKWPPEKFKRKNLRALEIEKLEDGFGGTWNDNDSFRGS
jgi:hypothetical protein